MVLVPEVRRGSNDSALNFVVLFCILLELPALLVILP